MKRLKKEETDRLTKAVVQAILEGMGTAYEADEAGKPCEVSILNRVVAIDTKDDRGTTLVLDDGSMFSVAVKRTRERAALSLTKGAGQ